MKHVVLIALSLLSVAGLTLAPSGCQSPPPQPPFEQVFFGEADLPQARAIFDAQAAHGARSDGTLYARHFDGPALTILGQDKLDLMLADSANSQPLVVYLDIPGQDGRSRAWIEAIRNYLTDAGLKPEQFKIETGPNPATLHPSAPAIARLSKTENPAVQSALPAASPDTSSAAPDMGNPGGMTGRKP